MTDKIKIRFPARIARAVVTFPATDKNEELQEIIKICGGVETFQLCFHIELSCGDGKYYYDFAQPIDLIMDENGDPVDAVFDEESLEKYYGKVDYSCVPRIMHPCQQGKLKANKPYTFEVVSDGNLVDFYVNSKLIQANVPASALVPEKQKAKIQI